MAVGLPVHCSDSPEQIPSMAAWFEEEEFIFQTSDTQKIVESENHRVAWVEKDPKVHLVSTALLGRVANH